MTSKRTKQCATKRHKYQTGGRVLSLN